MQNDERVKAWVVSADMGLGHQRAANPLRHIAEEGVLAAGSPEACTPEEQALWDRTRNSYELLSRIRSVPIIGKPLFGMLDELQKIEPFYPRRDLSRPTYQVRLMDRFIKKGVGNELLRKMRSNPLPMVTSFMIPAIAADHAGYEPVYCIICDAEISRAWVAKDPSASKMIYLAPCGRAVERLKSYGVPADHIILTGFPLPDELLGGPDLPILKTDLAQRLQLLDPNKRFHESHRLCLEEILGKENCEREPTRPLTITYAVGGAGAQREIGREIAESLRDHIRSGTIHLNLVAGIRPDVNDFFEQTKVDLLPDCPHLRIVHSTDLQKYFDAFNATLRNTDLLWTKPSELSFYAGLGVPIIITQPLGAQEHFNTRWLKEIQACIMQDDPRYAAEWLLDLIQEGRLADAAWSGFLKARKCGTYAIETLLKNGKPPEAAPVFKS